MAVKFTLADTLEKHNITRRQFSRITGIRSNTIIDLCAGTTQRISVEVIEAILKALKDETGVEYDLSAIMVYLAD